MAVTEASQDVWRIDRGRTWPPHGRLEPPISPSRLARLEQCWLSATFQASRGYQTKSSVPARLGTAFHQTMEGIRGLVLSHLDLSEKEIRQRAVAMFDSAVAEQKRLASKNPREAQLQWPETFVEDMQVSIAVAAGRLAKAKPAYFAEHPEHARAAESGLPEMEETLKSRDGLLLGRPDLVERKPEGVVIVDYKTGGLDDVERVEGYRRQCLLYAWLWHDHTGQWPVRYELNDPVTGKVVSDHVDPGKAAALADEARQIAVEFSNPPPLEKQASPGEACRFCSYRPWCEPFWTHYRERPLEDQPGSNYGRVSLQCRVEKITQARIGGKQHIILDTMAALGPFTVEAPSAIFPQLTSLQAGAQIRVLDARKSQANTAWLELDTRSEAFVLS